MYIISITSWWQALSGNEQLYWGIALIATIVFGVHLLLSFAGFDAEMAVASDFDDMDGGFSIFSFRGIVSFFLFFGWGGVVALNGGFGAPQALMIAFLFGFLAMVAIAYVFAQMLKLQESGTVDIDEAINKSGEVYLTIPANKEGLGKIQMNIAGKTMEFDAVTEQQTLITGTKVKVKNIYRDNVMLVELV
jgi:hypothetical protein